MAMTPREKMQRTKYNEFMKTPRIENLRLMGQYDRIPSFEDWNDQPQNQPLFEIPTFYRGA